jgi:hypothetical protein
MTNHEHPAQRRQSLVDVATACNGQSHDQAIINVGVERFQAGAACCDLTVKEKKSVQTSSVKLHLATTSSIHHSCCR